jgi:hypothetical protein
MALGIFVLASPAQAAKVWGSKKFHKLSPEQRSLCCGGGVHSDSSFVWRLCSSWPIASPTAERRLAPSEVKELIKRVSSTSDHLKLAAHFEEEAAQEDARAKSAIRHRSVRRLISMKTLDVFRGLPGESRRLLSFCTAALQLHSIQRALAVEACFSKPLGTLQTNTCAL